MMMADREGDSIIHTNHNDPSGVTDSSTGMNFPPVDSSVDNEELNIDRQTKDPKARTVKSCDVCLCDLGKGKRRMWCKNKMHLMCSDCFLHWVHCDASLGDGYLCGCPQLCENWTRLRFSMREVALRVGGDTFDLLVNRMVEQKQQQLAQSKRKESDITRIVNEIVDYFNVKCPSCKTPFVDESGRGCDAVWCSNPDCRRAFCILCLRDCGDDESANRSGLLKGDAHRHVESNDCGLTNGNLYNGHGIFDRVHHKRAVRLAKDKLKYIVEGKRRIILRRLPQSIVQMMEEEEDDLEPETGVHVKQDIQWDEQTLLESRFLQAVFEEDMPMIEDLLVQKHVNVNCQDVRHKTTPLHYAALHGNPHLTKLLLDKGANPNITDWHGKTPLHSAANFDSTGDLEQVVQLLLENGANPLIKTNGDLSPLDLAMLHNRQSISTILQSHLQEQHQPKPKD